MRPAVCLVALALAGCNLGDPGERIATLEVEATLTENSCEGPLGGIPGLTRIEVTLYEREGLLTWSAPDGSFQAEIDPEGNFVFRAESQALLREEYADWDGYHAPCVVDQVEEVRGRLVRPVRPEDDGADGGDAGDSDAGGEPVEPVPASVEATDTLRISPSRGADCSDMIGLGPDVFATLPCRVVMHLEGSEPSDDSE